MIRVQGPNEEDFYYREIPRESYTVQFAINNQIVYQEELDYNPSRSELEIIFEKNVKTVYPDIELV